MSEDLDVETLLKTAIYDRMASDRTLVDRLASYRDGAGFTVPAVFVHGPVPLGAVRPYVVVPEIISGSNWDTKDRNGFTVDLEALAVADQSGTSWIIGPIASRVQWLFHKYPLNVAGFQTLIAWAMPPTRGESDETLIARRVPLRFVLRAL